MPVEGPELYTRVDVRVSGTKQPRPPEAPSSLLFSSLLFSSLLLIAGCSSEKSSPTIGSKQAASYQNWAPWLCNWYFGQDVSTDISIKRWQQRDYANSDYYANNAKRFWPILFNQNVEWVSYRFAFFNVPDIGDQFSITDRNGTSTYTANYPPPELGEHTVKYTGNHTGATYLEHQWETSNAGNSTGYKIDLLHVRCLVTPPTPANTTFVVQNRGYDGILLGTDDVMWVWTTQPANKEMSILLWPVDFGSGAGDFDLFVSTNPSNPMPTAFNYNYASTAGGSTPELIVIPPSPSSRSIYVTIGSWSGAGQFRFYANVHAPGYAQNVRVITDWPTSAETKAVVRDQVINLVAAQYFATDGRHLIRTVDLYWNRPPPNNVPKPWMNMSGWMAINQYFPPCAPNACDHVTFGANWCNSPCEPRLGCQCANTPAFNKRWAGSFPPHEIGHCYYTLGQGVCADEYCSVNPTNICGHSLMTDFETGDLNMVDYCDGNNGGLNPPTDCAGGAGHALSGNNWSTLEALFPSNPPYDTSHTPDPFWEINPTAFTNHGNVIITEH